MEKDLWMQLSQKIPELEEDREKTFYLKSEMDKLKKKDKHLQGPMRTLLLTIEFFMLLSGLVGFGFLGLITNFFCLILPMSGLEKTYIEWLYRRNYIKYYPALQNQMGKMEKENKEKYKKKDWIEVDELIVKKIFSAEAVRFVSEQVAQQQNYDLEHAIDVYCCSDDYRPNLVKMNSEKNIAFLEMIWGGENNDR